MPEFLDTRGRPSLGIGICGRCSRKFPLDELHPDPNSPGLRVCIDDLDQLDPWRLPPRDADNLTLEYPRPDVALVPGSSPVSTNQIQLVASADGIGDPVATNDTMAQIAFDQPVASLQQSNAWLPNTGYYVGQQITPINPIGTAAVALDIFVYTCLYSGTSGVVAPIWPTVPGQVILDGQILWQNAGVYMV